MSKNISNRTIWNTNMLEMGLSIFFHKMATAGHFGCQKITFDHISLFHDQYAICILIKLLFTKWPPPAIVDAWKSCTHFSPFRVNTKLSNNFTTCILKIATGGQFFTIMVTDGHLGWTKITFYRIACDFRNYWPESAILWFFFTKWLLMPILDARRSLSITFLAISDQ